MNQIVRYHTSKKATKEWSMILWYNMIGIAALNAYIIFTQIKRNDSNGKVNHARQLFLKELAKQLEMPNVERRKEFPYIRRSFVEAIKRYGLFFGQSTAPADHTKLFKKTRGYFVTVLRTER